MCSLPLQRDSHGEAISEWEKCQSTCTKDSKVWGCLSWKDVGYNMTEQAYTLIPVWGFSTGDPKQMETFECCATRQWTTLLRCQRCSCGPAHPWHFSSDSSLPSFCKFVSWGNSALCAGSSSQQRTEAETKSGIQTLHEEGSSPLVMQTKIREWLERRTCLT